jgi:hypothetical protein
MSVIDFIAIVLATGQTIEVWHHSDLTAGWRAEIDLWPDDSFWADLLSCMFCLSVWVAGLFVILWWQTQWSGYPEFMYPAYALGASRAANIVSDLTKQFCQTPNRGQGGSVGIGSDEDD